MATLQPLMMKLAMTVSPYPTFPRMREKGQTNRCASFVNAASARPAHCLAHLLLIFIQLDRQIGRISAPAHQQRDMAPLRYLTDQRFKLTQRA